MRIHTFTLYNFNIINLLSLCNPHHRASNTNKQTNFNNIANTSNSKSNKLKKCNTKVDKRHTKNYQTHITNIKHHFKPNPQLRNVSSFSSLLNLKCSRTLIKGFLYD